MRGRTDHAEQAPPETPRPLPEGGGGRPLVATMARWPLDADEGFDRRPVRDPWESLVRDSMVAYREGRTDVAHWSWTEDVLWRVAANGYSEEHRGAEAIFAYHRRLTRSSGGTFRQRVMALQSSRGPIVEAYLRSSASRGARRLSMPTLVIFELGNGRIRTITEMPGDPIAWGRFWTD